MVQEGFKRKLTAILSADVVRYSRLMEDNEEATIQTLNTYRKSMTTLIQQHRGRVVDTTGDNLMAEFASAVDAVNCAAEIQRELAECNADLPDERKMEFRIGINVGDVVDEEDRIYGNGVNIAARMEALAEGGGICMSGTVYDQVKNKLGLDYESLGEQTVKNISEPIRAYRVLSYSGVAAYRAVKGKRVVGISWRNTALVIGAILVVGAGVFAVWHYFLRAPRVETASEERMVFSLPAKPSIAVLPFVNISGVPEQEYVSDGITEQIITSLSKIPHLFVIARNSTFAYKGKSIKVQQVAEDLGVRHVLEGSVQTFGEQIRISAQLIDALTGIHLWAEHYDRNLRDIFALQDEITSKIITSLQIKLTEGEYARAVGKSTSDLRALECFWRGEYHILCSTKEDLDLARKWLEKAIEADPNFSGAWALLGLAHMMEAKFSWSESPIYSFKRMAECAQKALSLDDSNPKAHMLMSWLHYSQIDFDKAVASAKKAVALCPNGEHMLGLLATMMVWAAGRHEEAITLTKKAMRLSPYYADYHLDTLGFANFHLRHYEEAITAWKSLQDRNPNHLGGYTLLKLAGAYSELGQSEKARVHAAEFLRLNPNFSLKSYLEAWPYKNQADADRISNALRKALQR